MKKIKVIIKKPVYLGLSILEISKALMYELWYDYIKPKYQDKTKLCYMDTDSFIIYIKTKDFSEDIADDAEKRFDTSNYEHIADDVGKRFDKSNYEVNRPLPTGKNEKVVGLMKVY